ncbi:uncharacterized protein EKO05_0009652 [Ascochyta rabiei]|uniref:Termination of G-protein coupled receptor signaling pathway n=1 Tax=Didymella rabiei TaxID=5454 RepID=A0A163CQA8_DIDRA|nr:uncharacterized protein EKO05_0009652 [Ascochyta rabiei]KZM22623.1 termination of G-protein coupled receptor signaling pathway [Ascochyta rabiei]UPX19388.1 hypothetical protein EKO05_0009652 [Ascochyta rabiei]
MDAITVYNVPSQPPKWDSLGIFYVTYVAVWTAIVAPGMAFCLCNRHIPALRMRSLPLAFSGLVLLHLYWCMGQFVYPIGATMPVVVAYEVEYFIMGLWFPLGIALFHAANLKFLKVAELQKQFESTSPSVKSRVGQGRNVPQMTWMARLRAMDRDKKTFVLIGVGMVFQVILTIGMWAACRKYHPGFGIAGTEIKGESLQEQAINLGRGWEWWPSVVWQFVWTWMVAPFLIWSAWDIRDTLGWRMQTIGACISGLHATPMFLVASYSSVFYTSGINTYFPPSQWIHLNTMFIEIFTVFVPAYQIIKHWRAQRLVAAAKWDSSSHATTISIRPQSKASKSSAVELIDRDASVKNLQSGDRLLTMSALTRVLNEHPAPLQDFSARKDFSGENIAFLTRLARWKDLTLIVERKKAYNAALRLYIDFVSPRDADFPLNLSSNQLKALEDIFETQTRAICGETSVEPALPFFDPPRTATSSSLSKTAGCLHYEGDVPEGFHRGVFDDAKQHVENLVLTNTWPKFVREMQERRRESVDSERSAGSDGSARTVVSRITKFIAGLR